VEGEQKELNAARGWFLKWESVEKKADQQGLAIIFDPALFVNQVEDKLNQLVLTKVSEGSTSSYWAGFCWDKAGQFADQAAWKRYVDEFARGLSSPIEVKLSAN
jgi:hypothetical protein